MALSFFGIKAINARSYQRVSIFYVALTILGAARIAISVLTLNQIQSLAETRSYSCEVLVREDILLLGSGLETLIIMMIIYSSNKIKNYLKYY